MSLKNTKTSFGLISLLLHWSIACLIIILIPLGFWMTTLDYYDPWYIKAPDIHRHLGMIVGFLIVLYIIWRKFNTPSSQPIKSWEKYSSKINHWLLIASSVLIVFSGYLISSAKGKSIVIFDKLTIPALLSSIENQADLAGKWHYILSLFIITLIALHVLGALKHHFIDQDQTLKKMFGITGEKNET